MRPLVVDIYAVAFEGVYKSEVALRYSLAIMADMSNQGKRIGGKNAPLRFTYLQLATATYPIPEMPILKCCKRRNDTLHAGAPRTPLAQ